MEADWEFEIGGDAPVIEADWQGFVDVRSDPTRIREIKETEMLPGLTEALLRLNSVRSPVWTSKTDVFVPESIDPDELSSSAQEARFAIASYIDILMRGDRAWKLLSESEEACRNLCARMREISLVSCRVDLVVRRAHAAGRNDLGVTVYLTACGLTPTHAKERLAECLGQVARVLVPDA